MPPAIAIKKLRKKAQSSSASSGLKLYARLALSIDTTDFAALAGVAIAAFTFTLWVATDQLAKSGQRIFEATERAFVFLDGFNYELTTVRTCHISLTLAMRQSLRGILPIQNS